MKKNWDKLTKTLSDFEAELNIFLRSPNIPISLAKKAMTLKKSWDLAIKQVNAFEQFMSPIEEIALTLPEGVSEKFIETWCIYKDYMIEQHGIIMRSRMELYRLKKLFEYSNNDPEIAIKYLEYYMTGYKSVFKVIDSKKYENENTEPHISDF